MIFSRIFSSLQCHRILQNSFYYAEYAQETILVIINVENSCASFFSFSFFWNRDILYFFDEWKIQKNSIYLK